MDHLFHDLDASFQVPQITDSQRRVLDLKAKFAQDRAGHQRFQRMADDAALPSVIEDYKASVSRADAVQQRIDLAISSLSGPPPAFQQPQLNQGEQMAAAIAGVFSPGGMNEVLQALQTGAAQRSQAEFDNALRAYGLNRETAKMALQQLMGQLDTEQGLQRELRGQRFDIEMYRRRRGDELGDIEAKREWDEMMLTREEDFKRELARYGLKEAEIKAEVDKLQERNKVLENAIDNFRQTQEVQFRGSDVSLAQAKSINDDADALADEYAALGYFEQYSPEYWAFRKGLGNWSARTIASTDLGRERFGYQQDQDLLSGPLDRRIKEALARKHEAEADKAENPPAPGSIDKAKKIASLTGKIEDKRREVDALLATPPSGDEEEMSKWGAKLQQAVQEEYLLVRDKRKAATGEDTSFSDYATSRWPSPVVRVILGKLGFPVSPPKQSRAPSRATSGKPDLSALRKKYDY